MCPYGDMIYNTANNQHDSDDIIGANNNDKKINTYTKLVVFYTKIHQMHFSL